MLICERRVASQLVPNSLKSDREYKLPIYTTVALYNVTCLHTYFWLSKQGLSEYLRGCDDSLIWLNNLIPLLFACSVSICILRGNAELWCFLLVAQGVVLLLKGACDFVTIIPPAPGHKTCVEAGNVWGYLGLCLKKGTRTRTRIKRQQRRTASPQNAASTRNNARDRRPPGLEQRFA